MRPLFLLSLLTMQSFTASASLNSRTNFPVELREATGLSDDQLKLILTGQSAAGVGVTPASKCTETKMTIEYPNPTLPSHLDVVKRNAFVARKGTQLTLAGEPFRVVGGNVYWLGLDENVIPDPSYPSKRRVLEMMGVVSAMRGTTIRGHTLGISFGNPLSVEPSLDKFNEAAYDSIDFAIAAAKVYGIKASIPLVIPLVDNYNWYHGGKYQFIEWAGIPFNGTGADITPPNVGAYFYNTSSIVDSFKRYITHHLSHVNRYTGIALKDDPTIMAWESGNELSGARFGDGPAPATWTKEIGELVKKLAPKQLFVDGSYGIFPRTGQLENEVVDIFSDHFYPANITKLQQGMNLVKAVGRNYLAGEFDWVGANGGDPIDRFLETVKDSGFAGDFFWSLFGHDDQCCQYVEHGDGFSFYYQRDVNYIAKGDVLINHATQISGKEVPEIVPQIACPATKFPFALL